MILAKADNQVFNTQLSAANDAPYMAIVDKSSNVHANWGFWETIKVVVFGIAPHNAEEILQ